MWVLSSSIFAPKLTFSVTFCDRFPLIIRFLSAGKPQLNLDNVVFEIDAQGNKRQPFFGNFSDEPPDFLLMHQQLSITTGIVIVDIPLFKRTDVEAKKPDF